MMALADFGSGIVPVFGMTDEVRDRHASPWSVWTRVPSVRLPFVAIWFACLARLAGRHRPVFRKTLVLRSHGMALRRDEECLVS